jgi:hypothetical protein
MRSRESFSFKPFQNNRPRVALQAGMHEGLTLLEGSS